MSVIIKGMSGCECCADCEFCGGLIMPDDIYVCDCPPTRGMDITRAIEEDCRHPDCPLIELPEKHGRLVDADALGDKMSGKWTVYDYQALGAMPTIVESEGEE